MFLVTKTYFHIFSTSLKWHLHLLHCFKNKHTTPQKTEDNPETSVLIPLITEVQPLNSSTATEDVTGIYYPTSSRDLKHSPSVFHWPFRDIFHVPSSPLTFPLSIRARIKTIQHHPTCPSKQPSPLSSSKVSLSKQQIALNEPLLGSVEALCDLLHLKCLVIPICH